MAYGATRYAINADPGSHLVASFVVAAIYWLGSSLPILGWSIPFVTATIAVYRHGFLSPASCKMVISLHCNLLVKCSIF